MSRFSNNLIRVLIVDDSALMRQLLTSILDEAEDIEVVGTAPDPLIARKMIKSLNPDVITLDIEMPKMDGIEFLSKIMSLRPTPVVMISSLTQERADVTLKALEIGAVDYVAKPSAGLLENLIAMKEDIVRKVRVAANSHVIKYVSDSSRVQNLSFSTTEQLIAIGASTGGVQAITQVLSKMPANSPAIVIVQHMPKEFTKSFAARLDAKISMNVSEARHGDRIIPGHVFIAPGGVHTEVVKSGAYYTIGLRSGLKVSGHQPSIDVLFSSVAKTAKNRAIGVIMTGMGKDGAKGLHEMREAGSSTIGQDESSSTVYGMNRHAYKLGAVQNEVPLSKIASNIINGCLDVLNV